MMYVWIIVFFWCVKGVVKNFNFDDIKVYNLMKKNFSSFVEMLSDGMIFIVKLSLCVMM